MKSGNWPAPAKLNLFLHVTGRRADGYHELQTLFQFIDYCDLLDFTHRNDGKITRQTSYTDIPYAQDLTIRAAQALQAETGSRQGVEIHIEKRLPMGGGLGGGSSDAATVLVALNRIWSLGLSQQRLAKIGLGLGADIPIFIHGHAAWAEGVGERLTAVEPGEPWYLIICPDCHISTAEIFAAEDLTRNTPAITIRDFLRSGGHNDCEAVVRRLYPEVGEALEWLGQFARAQMTGTGACIFAGFDNQAEAEDLCSKLPGNWRSFVARGTNRSPLLDRLAEEEHQD